jgi:hypothetical protein
LEVWEFPCQQPLCGVFVVHNLTKEETNMRKPSTDEKALVTIDLPSPVVAAIEARAAEETISRAAWIRRLVIRAAREPAAA